MICRIIFSKSVSLAKRFPQQASVQQQCRQQWYKVPLGVHAPSRISPLSRQYHNTPPTLSKDDESSKDESSSRFEKVTNLADADMSEDDIQKLFDKAAAEYEAEELAKTYPNWKAGERKRPLRVSFREQDFYDEISDLPRWSIRDKRCGVIAMKVGMIPVWDAWGERIPCTILWMDNNVVLETKNLKKHGYDSIVVGAGEYKKKNVTKPLMGYYASLGIDSVVEHPPYIVREFRINRPEMAMLEPGTRLHASHFLPGQKVDVAGISKGKGFQGPMKRWGFKGLPATHGVSKSHRAHGSTGQCQNPGRVFKGKKMAGRMGGERVTVQGLRIVKIDRGRDLIYVKGAVPGNKGGFVEIKDAVRKTLFGTDFVKRWTKEEANEYSKEFPPMPTHDYEEHVDGCGKPGFEVWMPESKIDPFAPEEMLA